MTRNDDFVGNLFKKERATATAATAAAEEFSQSIQVPSSTHPGTTYPVRTIPHSDKTHIYIYTSVDPCISMHNVKWKREKGH